ncbi:MAG: plasmid pRiA4b ORF-3 family protein, partial [Treponema sp.]|nr:plasmid pRiA4b ORF-3 family protein [Treponema sp.]
NKNNWVSRRGCFESLEFVITPSRLEIQNGILIPGHRCVPFANPAVMPHEFKFYWKGKPVPVTTTEGPPEDFYPFYTILGEEYAPQYVARDNPDNENAFNSDPYEDPPEVSIHTLDMRNLYRETAFVPGDRFVVRTRDWKTGIFELKKADKDKWSQSELYAWFEAAEIGFHDSFERLGPGTSTDEQIAYAYWYGDKRMREVPAYSLEEFLYEKTETIETVAYGIETRFWFAGREIPDRDSLEGAQTVSDRTYIEELLYRARVPISEFVIQSYIRDALFRNDTDINHIVERIVPHTVEIDERILGILTEYVREILEGFRVDYSVFTDKAMGPIRQRVGELHTAVIDLSARLFQSKADSSWFPRHTFVVLSQIQSHAAVIMEDLDVDELPVDSELDTIDNSLDSMIETYEDIKELIDDALDSFRRNNLSVVKKDSAGFSRRNGSETLQISLGGTDIWRRIILPASCRLSGLHRIIQILFGWDEESPGKDAGKEKPEPEPANLRLLNFRPREGTPLRYRYSIARSSGGNQRDFSEKNPHPEDSLEDLHGRGVHELLYEYGNRWTVKILFFGTNGDSILVFPAGDGEAAPVRCVAGEGASPPAFLDGPMRFKKFLASRNQNQKDEYDPAAFDMAELNRLLAAVTLD